MRALHEDPYTLSISRTILLKMENVSEKVVYKIKTTFMFSISYKNCYVYEIMWKYMVQPERQHI
jgi:hypothetical protein